ncbi:MAG: FGGY-family carbohydrate kinase [Synergistaceae bacterium]|jgi:sugar (pentulose or hexulose) kinase|nr:FGGY-family carbohydrate kinase [Synergistaceae bacterium]
MDKEQIEKSIAERRTYLGIELGSTRIKAVLIGADHAPIASGAYDWENRLEKGVWTYRLDDAWAGLQSSFRSLAGDVRNCYGVPLESVGAIGISGMMHGYLVFNSAGRQLVPFRTWRNTITEKAAALLTEKFEFNVPQRWNIAHLYQAILNQESHVGDIAFLTTLAGYIHWKLTGKKVLGVGEASGVFPIGSGVNDYDARMVRRFDEAVSGLGVSGLGWRLTDILPKVLTAGDDAGTLTEEGARLLGGLAPGIPMCPPEGDAGTGMAATNSVAERTGSVSAGTSIFAMIVLERPLSKVYAEIDMVTTPSGKPVAMVHCNNCTSDLDAWVKVFRELAETLGARVKKPALYDALYFKALEGEPDGGGILSYNYYGGEPITGLDEGRPLLVRAPDSRFTLPNLMRAILFSAMATLKIGMDILTEREHVRLDTLLGHGGLFKTKGVGQRLMASALNVPVAVMDSAGEGGAWGIALLAAYMKQKADGETLEAYLAKNVFGENSGSRVEPNDDDARGFAAFMERYEKGLAVERAAVENLR